MATFGTTQTAVSKRLLDANNTAVSASDVANAINDSISYWKLRRFWFNEGASTLTMTAQDGTIPLATDFLVPAYEDGAFQIEYSDSRYPMSKIGASHYNSIWTANGYGLPKVYARVGQTYQSFPLPDRAYTIKCAYLKSYADLVNDADTNDFIDNANRLILLWTLANLISEFRQDEKMETYFRNASNDEYRQLSIMTDKSNATGTLSIHSL